MIELMIPLYAIKIIVCKTKQPQKHKRGEIDEWKEKKIAIDRYLRQYLFDIHMNLGKVQVDLHDEK